jgi:beta-mannanase
MPSLARTILVGSALGLALACAIGVKGLTDIAESRGATTARGQTLFGMNVASLQALDDAESSVGANAAIVGTFSDWAHAPDFPHELAEAVNERGAVPLISWEPWDSWTGAADQPAYALSRIVDGDHDALIDRWAHQIATYGRPVMLRFAAEMNGDWLPWSTGVNGNRHGEYAAAWRHVRARFRRAEADNAIWVWNPIASYDGATPLRDVFPGRREVDWLAIDGYNWGGTRAWGWQSYADIFAPTVREFAELAPRLPVMIAETGSAPDPRKAEWVTDTLASARADGVDAVVWFEFAKETDWRLSESAAAAKAARRVLRPPGWRQGGDLAAIEHSVTRSR